MTKLTTRPSLINSLKKNRILLGVIVIGILFFGYFLTQDNAPEMRTATVKRQNLTEAINASGELQAKTSAELRFTTPSRVTWIGIDKGDVVKKWQSVASLDKRTLEKNLRKKLLDYQTTRWDFEQTQDNYDIEGRKLDDALLTEAERRILEKSQFGLDKSVLDVEIAKLAAEDSVLISPIGGTVVSIGGLVAGENLTAANLATKVIKIADLSSMQFVAQVDEVDYGKLRLGQKVSVMLDAFPNETFEGSVSYINKEGVKTLSGGVTIPIEITLSKADERLVVGLSGEADFIVAERQNVLTVPREFVKTVEGKEVVYILEDGKPVMKEVQTGIATVSQTEIISGIEENQQIILQKNGADAKNEEK